MEDRAQLELERAGRHWWWESRLLIAAVILLSAVPLLYPKIPPLVDLLGHMGRYRVQLDIGHSPWLKDYYGFHWAAVGNLGVDLLVMPLGRLMGLEPAVKLIVALIPPLTVAGFLWVASEVHHKVPPTAYFAVPFVYGHPFLFGFVNFALSMALAFLAFALWLRLARLGRTRLRGWLFMPISVVIFFCHTYGWGALGLLCFSAEAVRQHDKGIGWIKAGWNAALSASVMALPLIIMLIWRSETHGGATIDWFNWHAKLQWLIQSFRDRWKPWDIFTLVVTLVVIVEARRQKDVGFSRNLAFSALVLVAFFILLPRIVFGSAYADMRLIPYAIAVAILAIRFRPEATARKMGIFAVLGLIFVVARLGTTTASLAIAANDQQSNLTALDRVPMGARVLSFTNLTCSRTWALPRDSHLGAMVVVRKEGFSNDQWVMEGLNLLDLKYWRPGHFSADPSQITRPNACPDGLHRTIDYSLANFPRDAFDYVWLINPAAFDPKLTEGMKPVWRNNASILYRLH